MRKRRVYAVVIAVAVVGVVVAGVFRSREPEYGGKKLGEWLAYAESEREGGKHRAMAAKAFGQIGTNAIPHLLKWMRYEPPRWKTRSHEALNWALASLNPHWEMNDEKEARAEGTVDAFQALGPEAAGAIPELMRILNDPKVSQSKGRVVHALGYLGKDAVPPLLGVLTNQQAGALRAAAIASMENLGTNAHAAIPVLRQCRRDKDEYIARNALMMLYYLELEPTAMIAALVDSLQDERPGVRQMAIEFLGLCGGDVRPAMPALLKALNDIYPGVRDAATNALRCLNNPMADRGMR